MSTQRIKRLNELLKREISEALYRELAGTDLDLATVSVTRVSITPDLRQARVYVSVRGDDSAADYALRTLRRHRVPLQKTVGRDIILKYTPVLQFERDTSIEKGDRVLDLLLHLDEPPDAPARSDTRDNDPLASAEHGLPTDPGEGESAS